MSISPKICRVSAKKVNVAHCLRFVILMTDTWRVKRCIIIIIITILDYRAYRIPELIPVLGSQPASGVSHKPGGRLPLLSARPTVTLSTLKTATTNFVAW